MDYKVKYEAAMDSAIRRWEAGLMTKEEVIQIFPDAFESEDEKTRKQIIELVKNKKQKA